MGCETQQEVREVSQTRVLVVDDQPLVCYALAQLLAKTNDLVCCGEVGCAASARAAVKHHIPALILLDLTLGEADPFGLVREWKADGAGLKVLALSRYDEAAYAERALRCGADGFVTKTESPQVVMQAIRAVLTGERFVSGKLAGQVLKRLNGGRNTGGVQGMECLSARESEVFHLLGEGRNNKEIAQRLQLSPKTVDVYRDNLKRKLNLPDTASLVRHAALWSERH